MIYLEHNASTAYQPCSLFKPTPGHPTECSNLNMNEPISLNSKAGPCPQRLEPMVRISERNLVGQLNRNFDKQMIRENSCCDRANQDLLPKRRRIRAC